MRGVIDRKDEVPVDETEKDRKAQEAYKDQKRQEKQREVAAKRKRVEENEARNAGIKPSLTGRWNLRPSKREMASSVGRSIKDAGQKKWKTALRSGKKKMHQRSAAGKAQSTWDEKRRKEQERQNELSVEGSAYESGNNPKWANRTENEGNGEETETVESQLPAIDNLITEANDTQRDYESGSNPKWQAPIPVSNLTIQEVNNQITSIVDEFNQNPSYDINEIKDLPKFIEDLEALVNNPEISSEHKASYEEWLKKIRRN